MIGRLEHESRRGGIYLAWLGLLMMAASFAWLQFSTPPPSLPQIAGEPTAPEEPVPVVVLDPGHGGQDSGTMKAGIPEKELTLDIARRAQRLLQMHGVSTILTRPDDSYVTLPGRAAIANKLPKCLFISIHFDDAEKSTATGVETYYAAHQISDASRLASWLPFLQHIALDPPNTESQSLAGFIQEALVAHTQAVNRGTKPEQFFVVANVRHPAVLVEGGFLTNKEDVSKLSNADYREQIAAAITDGVIHYREVLQHQPAPLAITLP